ncbi:hypothetical protein FS800_26520 [Agrobacterium vitis]|nr:hypothetical protein [Allorhizobium ampelinum]
MDKRLKFRFFGAIGFGLLGLIVGSGTGIVGGFFSAVAGVGVFTTIGIVYGLSAGPDIQILLIKLGFKI